jgi:uncharacterized protein YgbK (DUF1537 family)
MLEFMVIADDLSGACDTAVQFQKFGYPTVVLNATEHAENYQDRYRAMAITTNSRDLTPEAARHAVKRVCPILKTLKPKTIYKKIDSTWRGNIGAELEVLMKELRIGFAVICSAYPENQRLGIGGYLLVDGALLHHTAMARDPASPITEGYLPKLLSSQTDLSIVHLGLDLIEKGPAVMTAFIHETVQRGPCLFIADATEDIHLESIASIASTPLPPFVFTGSAGLSAAMLRCQKKKAEKQRVSILTVAGSVNPKSISQIDKLLENDHIKELYVPWEMLLHSKAEQLAARVTHATDILSNGMDLVIRTCRSSEDVEAAKTAGKKKARIGEAAVADTISDGLKGFTTEILSKIKIGGIMVTGGTTALSLLEGIGGEGIEVQREIEAGVPLGRIVGGHLDGVKIITKAGGFGSLDVFCTGAEIIKQDTNPPFII